jgi:hypothetical protein
MSEPRLEFEVHGFEGVGPNTRIGGRCLEYLLRVGDSFTVAFRYVTRGLDREIPDAPDQLQTRPASLRIERIEVYGRAVDALYPGGTGYITVSGDVSHLADGDVVAAPLDEVTARRRAREARA